jgi:hypothetical protein
MAGGNLHCDRPTGHTGQHSALLRTPPRNPVTSQYAKLHEVVEEHWPDLRDIQRPLQAANTIVALITEAERK